MGRNHRHTKNLKAEKAKVKLKQSKTKFLPKGLNVTNTSFKIKPIVLLEQLKSRDFKEPLSKRKLNIKDLLSRAKHHNENVRHSASEELAEMVVSHTEEVVNKHLWLIIPNVCTLMQDQTSKVRTAAVKVLDAIVKLTPGWQLEAYFDVFSKHMRCAMTNINKTIQEDSLLFLDCFLKYNSRFILECAETFLPDFLCLISRFRRDSNPKHTLNVNLGSRMTNVAWKIKVLSRLHAILETFHRNDIAEEERKKKHQEEIMKDGTAGTTFPIYKDAFLKVLEDPSLVFRTMERSLKSDVFQRYIINLVPLLYESWIEVEPENKSGNDTGNILLNEEASAILTCITNILYLLWKYLMKIEKETSGTISVKDVFLSNEGLRFFNYLITNFPYCQMEITSKRKKTTDIAKILETNNDPRCVKENLLICYMYSILHINYLQKKNVRVEMTAITTYVSKCLTEKYISQNCSKYMFEFLRTCLVENPQPWIRSGADLRTIIESTIICYNHMKNEKYKMELFNILAYANIKSQKYDMWLSSLPSLLCGPNITDAVVDVLLKLSMFNEVFQNAVMEQLPNILENLENSTIIINHRTLINNEFFVRKKIAMIFFYVPYLDGENLEVISDFIMKNPNSEYSKQFIIILQERLQYKNHGSYKEKLKKMPIWMYIENYYSYLRNFPNNNNN